MLKKITLSGLASTTLLLGGVDASVLDETPIQQIEIIADERIEVHQIDNIVETTLPWKGQDGIKVVADLGEPSLRERIEDKRKKEILTEVVDFGDGGFKVDMLLNERPDTNVFCYTIEGAENYDFFYQSPLTKEERAEGNSRPPEIEGSYAVYHKILKNNNYKTGKVMHIPRPQVWSLSDEETKVWANLAYNRGLLCVTVPQDFLDTAVYPVRVDPTFGYTSVGASIQDIANRDGGINTRAGSASSLPDAGSVSTVSASLRLASGSDASVSVKVFINEQNIPSSGNHNQALTVERTDVSLTTTPAWIDFSGAQSLSTGSYIINALGNLSTIVIGNTIYLNYDTASGAYYAESQTYASPENPWVVTQTGSDRRHSIYATYTELDSVINTGLHGGIRISGGAGL